MQYRETTALKKILSLQKRLKIIQGGTSAGKTIAILLILIQKAQTNRDKIISVVSETVPHLKRSSIRDFLNIMQAHNYYKDNSWNRTDYIYTFETGSKIEFFSADNPAKVRGPRRDTLFINEANNVSYETYTQLAIRTAGDIYLDYNPVSEFWVHTDILGFLPNDFIILTYKDNEFLSLEIILEIESRKGNRQFWQVFGLGELGESEGRIYTGWIQIDSVPEEARLEKYGLDFGYSIDPTASDAIYKWNDSIVFDEVIHQKGLSNRQISELFLNLPRASVIADSAEPKSIDEIASYGVPIFPANKGKDSIRQGIQIVQDQKVFVTKRSVNTLREYRNYLWKLDRQGKVVNEPSDIWNHHMDDIRYAVSSGKSTVKWDPGDVGGVLGYIPGIG